LWWIARWFRATKKPGVAATPGCKSVGSAQGSPRSLIGPGTIAGCSAKEPNRFRQIGFPERGVDMVEPRFITRASDGCRSLLSPRTTREDRGMFARFRRIPVIFWSCRPEADDQRREGAETPASLSGWWIRMTS